MELTQKFRNRFELAASFSGVGVEIGVEAGLFSETILTLGNVAHLYSVDPWLPIPGFFTEEQAEHYYRLTVDRLLGHAPRSTILRRRGQEASFLFPSRSLDFIYLDSSHEYVETLEELKLWWPKLIPGAIFAGHDYANGEGVKRAVDCFAAENNLVLTTTEKDNDLQFPYLINSWILQKGF